MDYEPFIESMEKSIRDDDKHMCNYLLIEDFDSSRSKLSKIYKILSVMKPSKVEPFELIMTALYHIDIYRFHFNDYCPAKIARRNESKIVKQRLFFVKLYKECTDAELTSFFKEVFDVIVLKMSCPVYLENVSAQKAVLDEPFMRRFGQFCTKHNLPILEKLGTSVVHFDGKRQRFSNSENIPEKMANTHISDYYPIREDRENLCLIYNDDSRAGSDLDVKKLKATFSKIPGFTIKIRSLTRIKPFLDCLTADLASNSPLSDMIVCCILTHGENGLFLDQQKDSVHEEEVINKFRSANVPSLGGKPRVFLFQVCRGSEENKFVDIGAEAPLTPVVESDGPMGTSNEKVFNKSDYLICHSTVPHCKSVRYTSDGSWFINRICKLIGENSSSQSLQSICMLINKDPPHLPNGATQSSEMRQSVSKNIFLEKPRGSR